MELFRLTAISIEIFFSSLFLYYKFNLCESMHTYIKIFSKRCTPYGTPPREKLPKYGAILRKNNIKT